MTTALDPRENRLTEVTAAVLDEVDGLAEVFTRHLLSTAAAVERSVCPTSGPPDHQRLGALARSLDIARVDVKTQVPTAQGGVVDLEVLLRPAVGSVQRGLLVWVEVKHGADLHGDQLDAYMRDIWLQPIAEEVERVVVLLAPRGWEPEHGGPPTDVVRADWQGVARAVKTAAHAARPPEHRWLVAQYIRYLKEEGLSDPEALTAVSTLALMEFNNAYDAAAGVCQYADQYVQDQWGARGKHKQTTGKAPAPAHGPGYFAVYDPHRKGDTAHPNWRGASFEWGLRDTSDMQGLDATRGAWVFMAGATLVTKDDPTKVDGNDQWLAQHLAGGFRRFWIDYYRFAVLRYPDELLNETTLEQQGHELGRWIVQAFDELVNDPPPA